VEEGNEPRLASRARATGLNVAIDGPAGAGKTTVGRGLGRALNLPVLDTGLMYRIVTKLALEDPNGPADPRTRTSIACAIEFAMAGKGEETRLTAGGTSLDEAVLHTSEIDRSVPDIAADPEVRTCLVNAQRALAATGPIIMLGRDIGTVVLPDAPVKIFLDASPEVRAARRETERNSDPTAVVQDMRHRDQTDAGRAVSPMRPADDAIILDTSCLSVEETVVEALRAVAAALESS
jgi:cytidylate kinase